MTTIGFIGAGQIGSHVAQAAIAAGYDVVMSNSREPSTLAEVVERLGAKARAATKEEAAASGDIVVVTVPFKAYLSVPTAELAGKIVLDTNNYYFERDGHYPSIDDGTDTVTGLLQAHLARSFVAKAFNAIRFSDITSQGLPAGSPNRRALGTASDFADAAAFVTRFHDEIGFDTVNAGPLSESWRLDRDRPAYGARLTASELTDAIAKATS